MTIPTSSTTIRVEENFQTDPDLAPVWTPVATGVRAHIARVARPSTIAGQVVDADLWADPVELKLGHRVVNERTDETFSPTSILTYDTSIGLDHVRAGLVRVEC